MPYFSRSDHDQIKISTKITKNQNETKIEKFQTEETLEIEISREEELMNIIERMDKFRCDDSDNE